MPKMLQTRSYHIYIGLLDIIFVGTNAEVTSTLWL